jgi:Dullard-like phosphatase family protein
MIVPPLRLLAGPFLASLIIARTYAFAPQRSTCFVRCHSTWPRSQQQRYDNPLVFHGVGAGFLDAQKHGPLPLTAKPKRQYDSDLIVFLDMDECLVHSQFLSSPYSAQSLAHQLQQQQRRQTPTTTTATVDSFRIILPDDGGLVHVHLRPGLDRFLAHITARYETHIFTAAMPVYANPVLDRLDPDGTRFVARWYREHCTLDAVTGAYVKNLNRLPPLAAANSNNTSFPLHRTVLVDNNPMSFLANPQNGILVNSFYTDATDTALDHVQQILHELEGLPDVRPALEERFVLQESLKEWIK